MELDARTSAGCLAHAEYLAQNQGIELDAHDEDRSLTGSSEAGRAAAHASSIVYSEPVAAFKAWLMAQLTEPSCSIRHQVDRLRLGPHHIGRLGGCF